MNDGIDETKKQWTNGNGSAQQQTKPKLSRQEVVQGYYALIKWPLRPQLVMAATARALPTIVNERGTFPDDNLQIADSSSPPQVLLEHLTCNIQDAQDLCDIMNLMQTMLTGKVLLLYKIQEAITHSIGPYIPPPTPNQEKAGDGQATTG